MAIHSCRVLAAIVVALVMPCGFGIGAPPAPKTDLDRIQGKWRVTEEILGGASIKEEDEEKVWAFKGLKLTGIDGADQFEAHFILDPSKEPATIDIVIDNGLGKDSSL